LKTHSVEKHVRNTTLRVGPDIERKPFTHIARTFRYIMRFDMSIYFRYAACRLA
jgi:hypothetical protein